MDRIEATGTPVIPRKPTAEDIALLSFAQQVELTMRDLYDVALTSGVFADPDTAAAVTTLREAHDAYSQALSGFLGRTAPNTKDNELFESLKDDFVGSPTSVAAAAAQLEDVGVATHSALVGQLIGTEGADLIASILVAEARHATVLKMLAGVTSLDERIRFQATALVPSTNQ